MNGQDMQVVGLCRFSYPAIGGYKINHDTIEDRKAFLYDEDRIAERFRYFEALTLPALRAQTDPDFTFIVVTGDDLPAPQMERLQDLLADIPQADIQPTAPGQHRAVMQSAINAALKNNAAPSLQFRLDDDDAVSRFFVERLRETATDCAALIRDNRHLTIDFSKGYLVRPDSQGIFARAVNVPLWTPALAMVVHPDSRQTVMNYSHVRMPQFMPRLSLPHEDMFIRGQSPQNGSALQAGEVTLLDAEGEAQFKQVFDINSDTVRQIFAAA